MIEYTARGIAVGLASSITVGPVAVMVIQRTLSKTFKSGVFSGLGVACADTLMAIIAYFFYSMLQDQIEQYTQFLRVVGGLIVVIVGLAIFFKNPVTQLRRNRVGEATPWKDFATIFGFTIGNFYIVLPYLLSFFAMFGVGTSSGNEDIASLMRAFFIILGFFLGAVMWWMIITFGIGLMRRRFRPRHMKTLNHISGIIIALLGICMILSTFVNLHQNVPISF